MGSSQPLSTALTARTFLGKTALGLDSLQRNVRGELSLLQRRALILANGQRDVYSLCQLLGPGSQAVLEHLVQRGYLRRQGAALEDAAPGLISSGRPSARTERSFLAARNHVLALIRQHPDPVARGWEWQLEQTSDGEDGLRVLANVLGALPPALGERRARELELKLPQLLPYEQLQRLDSLRQSGAKPADRPLQHVWY